MKKLYIPTRKKKKIAKMLEKAEALLKEVKEELKKLAKEQTSQLSGTYKSPVVTLCRGFP